MSKKNKGNKGYVVHPTQSSRPEAIPQASLISQRTEFTAQRTVIRSLPEPSELQAYREMDSELYDIMKREFAANGEHQREMQRLEAADRKTLINAAARNDARGMWLSWSVFVASLGVTVFFVVRGMPIGAIIGVLGMLPPIIAALRVRHAAKDDN